MERTAVGRGEHDSVVAARQAPFRSLYARSPQEALTRKAAATSAARVPASDPLHGEVEIGAGYGRFVRFGLDRHVGGLHDAPNPGDLLCAALAACQDATIRMVADVLRIDLSALEVVVEAELDVRGCLAQDPTVRVGFEQLKSDVRLAVAEQTGDRRLEALVSAAERCCVNLDTLRTGTEVTTSWSELT
jgi:uncharacterized OsmC-like protein